MPDGFGCGRTYETGGAWLDATAVARLGDGGVNSRVRFRYENGLVLTVNGASNSLADGTWRLPDWGWVAEGPVPTAGTVLGGVSRPILPTPATPCS